MLLFFLCFCHVHTPCARSSGGCYIRKGNKCLILCSCPSHRTTEFRVIEEEKTELRRYGSFKCGVAKTQKHTEGHGVRGGHRRASVDGTELNTPGRQSTAMKTDSIKSVATRKGVQRGLTPTSFCAEATVYFKGRMVWDSVGSSGVGSEGVWSVRPHHLGC